MSELFDAKGWRLYLTRPGAPLRSLGRGEHELALLPDPRPYRLPVSEALELTAGRVDLEVRALIFETFKKRRRGVYRAVPAALPWGNLVHGSERPRSAAMAVMASGSGPGPAQPPGCGSKA